MVDGVEESPLIDEGFCFIINMNVSQIISHNCVE